MELIRLEPLSADVMAARVDDLIALDRTIEAEGWQREHFAIVLPDKFRHSRLALGREDVALGFVVASRKGSHVHVHRLAVGPDYQHLGIGRRLVASVAASALADGLETMTLKVSAANAPARRFYEQLGFMVLEQGPASIQLTASNDVLATSVDLSGRARNA